MSKIIVCIDTSSNIDTICNVAAFAATQSKKSLVILHATDHHYELAQKSDLSGSIGIGVSGELLEELTKIDETRVKLQIKEGKAIIAQAKKLLSDKGFSDIEVIHQHGSFAEVLGTAEADLIIVGERSNKDQKQSDTSLEDISKETHKPILIAKKSDEAERFLIAFDGSTMANKAVDYIISSDLLKGLECHLLQVTNNSDESQELLKVAQKKLENAGFKVIATIEDASLVEIAVVNYITDNNINFLAIGAYGHSKLRNLIFGSTTEELIKKSAASLLLIR
jgi:nucleotide-binding universal stress UspA family protein